MFASYVMSEEFIIPQNGAQYNTGHVSFLTLIFTKRPTVAIV